MHNNANPDMPVMSSTGSLGAKLREVPVLYALEQLTSEPEVPGRLLVEVNADAGTYHQGHVPTAITLDWLDDLQHPARLGFVDAGGFAALMDSRGITTETHVVLLGDSGNRYAALLYWYFSYYGHRRVSLLDGGRMAWLAAGLPLTDQVTDPTPTVGYHVQDHRTDIRTNRDEILTRYVGAPAGTLLLDCRTPDEHHGEVTSQADLPIERHRVTGHIPGSRNLPSGTLVDERTGRLHPAPVLRQLFTASGLEATSDVAVYCRVADRSALMWFALSEVLEHPQTRHYDGGWAEYGSLIDAPSVRSAI